MMEITAVVFDGDVRYKCSEDLAIEIAKKIQVKHPNQIWRVTVEGSRGDGLWIILPEETGKLIVKLIGELNFKVEGNRDIFVGVADEPRIVSTSDRETP